MVLDCSRGEQVARAIRTRFSGLVRGLSQLRHDLLRVSTRAQVVEVGTAALRESLEPADEILFLEAGATVPDATALDRATFVLRSTAGHDHGYLVIVAEAARIGAASEAIRRIAEDLAQALDNTEAAGAARDVARLREALGRRDDLVRQAGDALMRDAHEVVRVVAELEQRDALINADLQQALRFQKAMIAPLPVQARLSMSAIYLAAEMISGDFYDVAFLEPDWLRIFLADATGHGVAAGLATMFIKSEYEAQKRISQAPAAVLRAINEQLSSTYRNLELQFTALCIDLHVPSGRLRYASAAHPGPVVFRSGAPPPRRLPSGGPFVGVITGVDFPAHEAAIEPGELLVMFSDGLLDATAPDGASFGEAGMARALAGVDGDGAEVCPALVRSLASFVGEGRGLPDDVTIVALAIRAS
jgi:serine phosphatase RsbU (regulator of sigma subunit)